MRTLLFILLALGASAAIAQDQLQQDLERCAAIESAIDKLDCFEALTERGREIGRQSASGPGSGVPLDPGASLSGTVQSSGGARPAPEPAQAPPLIPAREPSQPSRPQVPASAPESEQEDQPAVESAPVSSDPVAEFGREQLPDEPEVEEQVPDTVTATVAEVTEGVRGNLYFHMENGQVWRQIEARYLPFPRNEPFEVEINRGMLGEYRLRVGGTGRLVRIRRVE